METSDVNIKLNEGRHRRLGYAWEFKNMIREHPGVLTKARQLVQKAEDRYSPPNQQLENLELQWNGDETRFDIVKRNGEILEKAESYSFGHGVLFVPGETIGDKKIGLEIVVLGKAKRHKMLTQGLDITTYLKMQLGDYVFFVKKSSATTTLGYTEFKTSHRVREALRDLGNLEVVEAQLGYADDHQSWFVSRWKDLETKGFGPSSAWRHVSEFTDYGKSLVPQDEKSLGEYFKSGQDVKHDRKTYAMIDKIHTKLEEEGIHMGDLGDNLFYNPKTDKFFLLDVTTYDVLADRARWIGQPKLQ